MIRTAHIEGTDALSVAELNGAEELVPYHFSLMREEEDGLRLFHGLDMVAEYHGPRFWQELPFGPGADYVSDPVFDVDGSVELDVSGLTPSIVGMGLDFDIDLTAVQPTNPIQLDEVNASGISGQVNIDVDKLLEDASGTFEIIPLATMTVSGLTPDDVGEGLDFDIERITEGYYSASDRTDMSNRVIASTWDPTEDPAPATVDVFSGAEAVGTIQMLTEPEIGLGVEFTLNAAGSIEGTEDSTRILRFSVQPVSFEKAQQITTIQQGQQMFALYGSTRLKPVYEPGGADTVTIEGKTFECVESEPWQNNVLNHYVNYVVSNLPLTNGSAR